uniref:SAC domain-containing protein n=1 Tax=Haemonchus placei TaxID=6290 RepID=A0A0N4W715_HAEPC
LCIAIRTKNIVDLRDTFRKNLLEQHIGIWRNMQLLESIIESNTMKSVCCMYELSTVSHVKIASYYANDCDYVDFFWNGIALVHLNAWMIDVSFR